MWVRLIGLGVIEAALIAMLFWPIKTHAVKLDMPGPGSPHTLDLALAIAALGAGLVVNVLTIAVLLAPIWMAYRVIAKRRAR